MKKLSLSLLASSIILSLSLPTVAADTDVIDEKKWSVNQPQGEFSDVTINVQEGTWMNVDISPDGKTLVFDLLGDIYTMPVKGGKATAIRQGIAWHMQPTFSPDGSQIAFTSDQDGGDNIWIMDVDGSNARAVTTESFRLLNSPAWSPDGEFIVARKHYTNTRSLGAGEVWMYHKNGGSGVMLTKRPNDQKDLGEPAFSPDGRYVYFSQDATPGKTFHYSKDSVKGIYKIKRLDRETGEIEVIIEGTGGAIRPTPSPDGKSLAYISRDDFQSSLYIMDLTSGKSRKVFSDLERDLQETWAIHGVYPTMSWTPDNDAIVFWAGGKLQQLDIDNQTVTDIPFQVEAQKKIQNAVRFDHRFGDDEFDVKMLRNVQVSPDGSTAIFEALGYLYSKDLKSNKRPKRLTKQSDHFELYPQFSRDGKKIVYVTWNDKTQGSIRVVSARSGRGETILKGKGKYVEPTFSPDGETVVYRKIAGGYILPDEWDRETGIYKINLDEQKPERVSKIGWYPQFGDRNDRIFLMDNYSTPSLISVDLTTKERRTLYKSKLATEFKVSPDGKYLAFAERFKVFVTPFVERGSTIDIGPKDTQFPVEQLSVRAGEGINWSKNSDRLYWSLGPELYTASLEGVFSIKDNTDHLVKEGTNIGFKAKSDKPEGLVAFVGGQVITMNGDSVIENGVVLVEDNRIKMVGKVGDITIPSSAKRIDVTGKTVMPGIIDAHAHGPQGNTEIIPQQNWKNYAGLTFGVTTIHDPSNDTTEIFTASEMQQAGEILAPRIFSTGTIVYGAQGAGYTSHIDSLDDAKFHLERLKKAGAFSVKSYNQPRRDQRQQVIQAARELEMMVVPEGGSLMQHNLTMVADGHTTVEHALPLANIYDDVVQFWSASDTALNPTLVVAYGGIWGENYWYDKTEVWNHPRLSQYVPENILRPRSMRRPKAPDHHYNHINAAKVAKKLNDSGVAINIGAHGQREGLGAHWEIWMHSQGGMSNLNALKTATINPAISMGLSQQIGSLEQGKLADIIVIDGDPLTDIRVTDKVSYVMLNGRLYDAESMNEIGHYDQKREPFYFEK